MAPDQACATFVSQPEAGGSGSLGESASGRGHSSGHRFDDRRRWAASLQLGFDARQDGDRRVTRLSTLRHEGPLRVQRPFYPEGADGCCHVYLLHPPGGLVSGDALRIRAEVGEGAHALLTTPAAAKVYTADSHGVSSSQSVRLRVRRGGSLEYLPQETIAFDGARTLQSTSLDLDSGAACLGWEVLALGRPASDLPFVTGRMEQRFELRLDGRPVWHERQILDPAHPRFSGRWAQGGASVQATLWAVGLTDEAAATATLREALPPSHRWAVTSRRGVMLFRYLGADANEAWDLCERAWELLRPRLLAVPPCTPRIWRT
ncbi:MULTISPECIES: urease accessory protein UreD [unclassified Guyparkeria]|uniref:urease accessory protein UreD n=1 Tax=unclassified Guyparkeria TaxID=2626246 RepID=UPI0009EB31C4|nr:MULTISPECIES: urease accessory protein UreD [unclassified Guyparkeria]